MRTFAAAALATSLFATNVFSGDLPLPAGQPAGTKTAQDDGHQFLYLVGGAAIIAGIVILAANGSSNGHLTPGTPPSTSTST